MKKTKLIYGLLFFSALSLAGCNSHKHNLVHHDAVAPTCTTAGTIEYWSCSDCSKNFSDSEGKTEVSSIEGKKALGHDMNHTAAHAATCTEDGNVEYWACANCKLIFSDAEGKQVITEVVVKKKGHVLNEVPAVDPDCTTGGNIHYFECTECHVKFLDAQATEVVKEVEIAPLGHDMEYVPGEAPTCTDAGVAEHYHCERCLHNYEDEDGDKEMESVVIDPLGHTLTHVTRNEPTCTEAGNIEYWECSECTGKYLDAEGTQVAGNVVLDPLGHTMSHVDYKAATCTDAGTLEHYHCTECQNNYADQLGETPMSKVTIDALQHDVKEHAAKDPTKTEAGLSTTYYTCSRESGMYFSDKECTDDIAESVVQGYTIKSFDDVDAMLDGADGSNAYDGPKIKAAHAYLNDKYSSSALTAYGNGAVITARNKFNALYTDAELDLEGAEYWSVYGKQLVDGQDVSGTDAKFDFKGSFEKTTAGNAYTFEVKENYTGWAGARFGSFAKENNAFANVFYVYSPVATKVGLTGWEATPYITWDVGEGWNELIIPNTQYDKAHTSSQFRFVIENGVKGSLFKLSSVFGMKKPAYINKELKTMKARFEFLDDFNRIKTIYEGMSADEQKYVVGYKEIADELNGAFTKLVDFDGKKWYDVFGKALKKTADDADYSKPGSSSQTAYIQVGEMAVLEDGHSYLPIKTLQQNTAWYGFRYGGFPTSTTWYAGLMKVYSPYETEMGLMAWDNDPVAVYTLHEGWNTILIDNSIITKVKSWSGQVRIVFNGLKYNKNFFYFGSFYGLTQKQFVVESLDAMGDAEAYYLSKAKVIKAAYDGLDKEVQDKIDVSKLNAFLNKYFEALEAKAYPSSISGSSINRIVSGEVGLAYRVSCELGVTSASQILNLNLADTSVSSCLHDEHKENDQLCFYTYGITYTTEKNDSNLQVKNGSTVLIGGFDHIDLGNGWVKNICTASRASNFWSSLNMTQRLFIFFNNIPEGTTYYVSSLFGIHA